MQNNYEFIDKVKYQYTEQFKCWSQRKPIQILKLRGGYKLNVMTQTTVKMEWECLKHYI